MAHPPLPCGTIYRRLAVGLDNGHGGWALDPAELEADGITPEALRAALGTGWSVRVEASDAPGDRSEVVVKLWDSNARADLERAFLDAP